MDSATVTQNCSFDTILDDFCDIELSDIDCSLVMSLFEDSQLVEGEDDERFRSVIQSLEAEITNNQDYSFLETNSEGYYDYQHSDDAEQMDSCSTSPDHMIHFEGIDVGLLPYSSPMDDTTSHFTVDDMVEFAGLRDYSHVCYGMAMEEEDYHGLWQ